MRRVATAVAVAAVLAGCAVGGPGLPSPEMTGTLPTGRVADAGPSDAEAPRAGQAKSGRSSAGQSGGGQAKGGRAKVAMLLPLSGPGQLAVVAKAMKQAGEMALFEGSNPEFQLTVKDDRGTPEGAKAAAAEAVRDGAELILGPLLAGSVDAAAPIAAAAGVPVVAFSNDRRVARPGVYLLSFMPEQDVERIVAYAAAQGRRNFAALLPDDAYGRIAEQAFTRAVAATQGNVVALERYQRSGAGMLDATRKLGETLSSAVSSDAPVAAAADALFMPGEPETLSSLGPLLAYARIDASRIKLLGTGGWDTPNLGRDQTFVGAWYPAPDQRGWQDFSEKFAKTFGTTPPRIATVAFDAVGVAVTLAANPAATRFTAAGLTRQSGFTGADGAVRFQADGTAMRALAVLEVQAFGSNVVDPPSGQATPAQGAPQSQAAARPAQVN